MVPPEDLEFQNIWVEVGIRSRRLKPGDVRNMKKVVFKVTESAFLQGQPPAAA